MIVARIQSKDVSNIRSFKLFPNGVYPNALVGFCIWYFVVHDIVSGDEDSIFNIIVRTTILALAIKGTFNLHNFYTFDYYPKKKALMDTGFWIIIFNIITLTMLGLRRQLSKNNHINRENAENYQQVQ